MTETHRPALLDQTKQQTGAPALGQTALTLFPDFSRLLAFLAPGRERQRPQPRLSDLAAAIKAVPEGIGAQTIQRPQDLPQRFALHLHERQADVLLGVGARHGGFLA